MSNSPLISYTKISPNKTSKRNHKIDTISPHVVVGQVSVERLGDIFANPKRKASSNYGIGSDGRIALYVDEGDRSWCTSNAANDHRAITIECASDTTEPYAINDKVYESLINLCVDICKRNDIKELRWKADPKLIGQVDKQNITVHRWFANKSCPGNYVYSRLGEIAKEVNARLNSSTSTNHNSSSNDFTVKVDIDDLNIRKGPGTNYDKNGVTGKGIFTITEVQNGQGSNKGWGKLKSGKGWISLDFATQTDVTNPSEEFKVKVDINTLNIRKGPGTNYEKNGVTGIGTFTITEVKSGQGSPEGWGKLKSGKGWISLYFARKI